MKKYCALFLLACGVSSGADFSTGQAARAVIGQPTFTAQSGTLDEHTLGGAAGVAYANGTIFVADGNRIGASPVNNRVLLINDWPAKKFTPTDVITAVGRCPLCGSTAQVVLGQPNFTTNTYGVTATGMRTPTAVATDGQHVVVADTDNNRVLIWNSIPTTNNQQPDVVVGQPDFTSVLSNSGNGLNPTQKGLRGPQGVWIGNGKLMVADTMNNRVLVWNSIPSANGAPADLVLGQPNFTTFVQADLTQSAVNATPSNMVSPVSVTTDATHMFVADLGQNRVMIWNSIPSSNNAPADVVIGQPSLTSTKDVPAAIANNVNYLCPGTVDPVDNTKTDYPQLCAATVNFPRFALSDGTRLFVSDGGNNRILLFNTIPTGNGARADIILGQPDDVTNNDVNSTKDAATDALRTPGALAWDGQNLYVVDTYNRRIAIYTPGEQTISRTGTRNAASHVIYSTNTVTLSGSFATGDTATIAINGTKYTYTIAKGDDFTAIVNGLVKAINTSNNGAGDPNVIATANTAFETVGLTARVAGAAGDQITISTAVNTNSALVMTTAGKQLFGSQDPANIAPGTLMEIYGTGLTDQTASADPTKTLPTTLANVTLYIDGTPAPLLYVSPTQINAQMPYEISDASSISMYTRSVDKAGTVHASAAVGVPITPENPGIFALPGQDPRVVIAEHASSAATGLIGIDGVITAGDVGKVTINGATYSHTVATGDTLESIRNDLVTQINNDANQVVTAAPAGSYARIVLYAKAPGKAGEGIAYSVSVTGSGLSMSAYTPATCCSGTVNSQVTPDNPARPGEIISIFTTGLGLLQDMSHVSTGVPYNGPSPNDVDSPVNALVGGSTANIVFQGLQPGAIGVYRVDMQLSSALPTNPQTQIIIAQDLYLSNVVTIPVVAPPSQ